jgi:prepilin-type N-terminal cleavage/methylation domain-containing protein
MMQAKSYRAAAVRERLAHERSGQAGLTLLEVVIAVTLVSILSTGILMAMRVALDALQKANSKLMDNRRVSGAQRVLEQQIAGFMPVKTACAGSMDAAPTDIVFFEGAAQSMRMVSTYSLQEAWRGQPRILEFQVIPGEEEGEGVRLVVNEIPYTNSLEPGRLCVGMVPDAMLGVNVPRFRPIVVGPQSFVLGDKLAWCRFSYLEPAKGPQAERWRPEWVLPRWPIGIRVEMAPLIDNPSRLRPLTITAAVRFNRAPDVTYIDF